MTTRTEITKDSYVAHTFGCPAAWGRTYFDGNNALRAAHVIYFDTQQVVVPGVRATIIIEGDTLCEYED